MLTVGSNSFVTLSYANSYMDKRFGGASWFALTIAERETLLITAFRWLVSEGVPKTATAEKTKWAQVELAWFCYKYLDEYEDREALKACGVDRFQLSKWEEHLSTQKLPQKVQNLIAEEMSLGGFFPDWERELEN